MSLLFNMLSKFVRDFQVVLVVKNLLANAGNKRHRFDSGVRKLSWRRAWQPTPVFFPGESHGQRSLAGYSPWGHKESDTTEVTSHARTLGLSYLFFQGASIFLISWFQSLSIMILESKKIKSASVSIFSPLVRFSLVISFIHSSVYMPIPIFQFIPPIPFPSWLSIRSFSTSVFLVWQLVIWMLSGYLILKIIILVW